MCLILPKSKGVLDTFTKVPKEAGMMGVGVVGCRIYGAVCNATCAIAASEMVWVERNGLVLRTPGTNFKKLPSWWVPKCT